MMNIKKSQEEDWKGERKWEKEMNRGKCYINNKGYKAIKGEVQHPPDRWTIDFFFGKLISLDRGGKRMFSKYYFILLHLGNDRGLFKIENDLFNSQK